MSFVYYANRRQKAVYLLDDNKYIKEEKRVCMKTKRDMTYIRCRNTLFFFS
jgi:hypothetical protein